jgi:hypothetical protein
MMHSRIDDTFINSPRRLIAQNRPAVANTFVEPRRDHYPIGHDFMKAFGK